MRLPWQRPSFVISRPLETPWTEEYASLHTPAISAALNDPRLIAKFKRGRRLPRGYGRGLDERLVEYPWLLSRRPAGRALDAGSALNHDHILDSFLPRFTSLRIVTLAPEPVSYAERGINYDYADLRDLPYPDGSFDTIVCISTLEHVGMDNSVYGDSSPRAADPESEVERALAELRRVLAPSGRLLWTVPFGRAEDHGWFGQFDGPRLERTIQQSAPANVDVCIFRYSAGGWQRSSTEEAADASYRDFVHDPTPVADRAAAARAVACIAVGW